MGKAAKLTSSEQAELRAVLFEGAVPDHQEVKEAQLKGQIWCVCRTDTASSYPLLDVGCKSS